MRNGQYYGYLITKVVKQIANYVYSIIFLPFVFLDTDIYDAIDC